MFQPILAKKIKNCNFVHKILLDKLFQPRNKNHDIGR